MNTNNNKKQVPEWSLQLTEQLISPPATAATNRNSNSHISPLPSSAIIIHSQDKDEQFQNYIDRQFTSNDATVLKNRLSETPSKKPSEATTLRNSSIIPPNYWSDIKDLQSHEKQQQQYHLRDESDEESEQNVWWLTKDDQDGFYSLCGLLFLFGFIFPPFWWIGSIWPKNVREKGGKMAERWQKLNRVMSIGFSSILIILIIAFVVLYATGNI